MDFHSKTEPMVSVTSPGGLSSSLTYRTDLFAVHGLREATFNKDMIKDLIVADATKKMVMALCEVYDRNDQENNLFPTELRGKGELFSYMVHPALARRSPPVRYAREKYFQLTIKLKSTELVAEYTARPLLTITAADLGDEPGTMERTLQRFFRDAGRWDAILLLDEADVYVAKRTRDNHKTNVIVSGELQPHDWRRDPLSCIKCSFAPWSTSKGSFSSQQIV